MSRRERARKAARLQLARQWAAQAEQNQPTLPFAPLASTNLTNVPTLLVARVSTRAQKLDLVGQIRSLRHAATAADAQIAQTIAFVANGADQSRWYWLKEQATLANAKAILWESPDRALRHSNWGKDHSLEPTEAQITRFCKIFEGFSLVTVLDPYLTQQEIWAYQAKRGQLGQHTGGRGKKLTKPDAKRARRDALQPIALQLRQQGYSLGAIARELGVQKRLIQHWLSA